LGAHTVGPDTIGKEKMLELDETFRSVPWRAMIIKDNAGDVGICVGAWKGLRKGVPGVKGTQYKKGVPGQPGRAHSIRKECLDSLEIMDTSS